MMGGKDPADNMSYDTVEQPKKGLVRSFLLAASGGVASYVAMKAGIDLDFVSLGAAIVVFPSLLYGMSSSNPYESTNDRSVDAFVFSAGAATASAANITVSAGMAPTVVGVDISLIAFLAVCAAGILSFDTKHLIPKKVLSGTIAGVALSGLLAFSAASDFNTAGQEQASLPEQGSAVTVMHDNRAQRSMPFVA